GPERSYGCSTILSFPIRQPLTRRASFEPPPTRRRVFLALQLSLLVLGVWSLPLASMARVSSCVLALGSVALTAIEFLCSSLISQSRLRYIHLCDDTVACATLSEEQVEQNVASRVAFRYR
ncbi:uncharacterized protein B0H18DRAFT_1071017, partial [Fomitopsis serialis]|uniref:uncharacterized protein n=1 Tax=Fomitopsis serialis TaxID=139415 RepID=UPI0020072A09